MARVLIAWELGEAFGHLARCLRLAEGLRERGHTVALALKDVRLPGGPGAASGFTVLAAPLTPHAGLAHLPVNYADMLRASGFAEPQAVAARLRAWHGVFALVRPDVLVADHAPTALLAARGAGVPHLAVGNGFAIPPETSPWPSIRPWEMVPQEALIGAEARLERTVEAAQRLLGGRQPVRMRELFGPQDVLDTFVELDHHGARPDGRYVGPIVSVPRSLRTAWQSQESPKVLAYLRPTVPGFMAILQALARLDAEVLCVAPGLAPEVAKKLASRRLRIALAPVELPPLLERADLAIGYGSGGFSTQALLAGVPLLMRPRHVEQALFAHRVEALSAGRRLAGRLETQGVAAAVRALLEEPACRQAAQAFAHAYRDFTPQAAIDRSLAAIEHRFLAAGVDTPPRATADAQEPRKACLH